MTVVGYLSAGAPGPREHFLAAFRKGLNDLIDILRRYRLAILLEHRPDAGNHFAHSLTIIADVLQGGACLFYVGRRACQPTQARNSTHAHCRQWLVDLVSDRSRHLAHRHHMHDTHQLNLGRAQGIVLSEIAQAADE